MTDNYVFTTQQWRVPVNAGSYMIVSHRSPQTDPYNTQVFYQTLYDVNMEGESVFAATDSLLALSSGDPDGSSVLLYRVSPLNGTWIGFKTLTPVTSSNTGVNSIAVNEKWLAVFTNTGSTIPGTLAVDFYTIGSDGYTPTYNLTLPAAYGSDLGVYAAITPASCADQFVAFSVQTDTYGIIIYHFDASTGKWNSTQFLTPSSNGASALAITCDALFATSAFNNVWYYKRSGTQWIDQQRVVIPDPEASCGESVSAYGSLVAIGCPEYYPGSGADYGRVVKYTIQSDLSLAYAGVLNNYCSSSFVDSVDVSFGAAVATRNNQIVVGVPNVNSGAGTLLQFGEPCGDSICVEGNTCIKSPFGAQEMCVCTVSPSPCTLPSSAAPCVVSIRDALFAVVFVAAVALLVP